MKKFNWIVAFILSYVTCGIYSLYMFYTIADTGNKLAEAKGKEKIMGFIPAFLLGCVTCGIYLIFWYYKLFKQQVAIAEESGVEIKPTNNPIILVLIAFVPIYSYYVICDNYNRIVEAN